MAKRILFKDWFVWRCVGSALSGRLSAWTSTITLNHHSLQCNSHLVTLSIGLCLVDTSSWLLASFVGHLQGDDSGVQGRAHSVEFSPRIRKLMRRTCRDLAGRWLAAAPDRSNRLLWSFLCGPVCTIVGGGLLISNYDMRGKRVSKVISPWQLCGDTKSDITVKVDLKTYCY